MEKPEGALLLACVCFMLVLVLGAVESGRVAGANYSRGLPIPGWNSTMQALLNWNATSSKPAANSTATKVSTASAVARPIIFSNRGGFPILALPPLPVPDWTLAAVAAGCFALACYLILRVRASVQVLDLASTLKEMELQQKRIMESWSSKLRNVALLRYYLLMRRACTTAGIPEQRTETLQEYIGRVSSLLDVESGQATKFARLVNRSRYGEELSTEDAGDASRFMSAFTEVIRRKTSAP